MTLLPLLLCTCVTALVFYVLFNLRTRRSNRLPPGPIPWPIVGNLPHLGTIPHQTLAEMAEKYGPLMHLRLGFVDAVVVTSASIAAQFLKVHDVNFASRPPSSGAKHIAYNYQDLVFAPYGPRWRMLRKICSVHLFSAKALDDFRHVRQEEVAILTHVLVGAGQSPNLLAAGIDTSSSSAEWAISELISHPQLLKKAQEEMDIVVGRDRLLTEFDLSQLPFLQAVVKETLRLHPPAPLSLPRIASESCEVNGYNIPKGSTLFVHVWAIARDPNIWTNPLEFRPDRFLPGGEKPDVDVKGNDFEVIPFGAGRRVCVGISLGLKMVQLIVATLVQTFDWELVNGLEPETLDIEKSSGLMLQRATPLMVHPMPRLAPHVYESC